MSDSWEEHRGGASVQSQKGEKKYPARGTSKTDIQALREKEGEAGLQKWRYLPGH